MFKKSRIYVISLFFILFSLSVFSQNEKPLRVLYATPEMYPLVCTGGLGEVAEFIPAAVVKEGNKVDVIMPKWSVIDLETHGITPMGKSIKVNMPWGDVEAELYEIKYKTKRGVRVILVDSPKGSNYFDVPKGQKIYYEKQYEENIVRFSFFSKAILEVAKMNGLSYYDVIHANDWTTALVPWYKKYDPRYTALTAKTVYSIHNLGSAFQGTFETSKLWLLQIDPKYLDPTIEGSVVNYTDINFTKAALVSADQVATVSPQYAKDIKGEQYGNHLNGVLMHKDIVGISHGIDEERYDPSINGIRYKFDDDNFTDQKLLNKAYVMDQLRLPLVDVPLFISTTRGDRQKNVILLYETLKRTLPLYKMQVVVMGDGYESVDMGVNNLKQKFEELERIYSPRFRFLKYDPSFHAQLEAGADFQFIISSFEPGGLEPSKAKANKVICIIHPVNGLKEAVIGENDPQGRPQTGIKAYNLNMDIDYEGSINRLGEAMNSAMEIYADKDRLKQIRTNMNGDYSWTPSGKSHTDMYKRLVLGPNYSSHIITETSYKVPLPGDNLKLKSEPVERRSLNELEVIYGLSDRTGSSSTNIQEQLDDLMKIWAENEGLIAEEDQELCFGSEEREGIYNYVLRLVETGKAEDVEEAKLFLTVSGALFFSSESEGHIVLARNSSQVINRFYVEQGITAEGYFTNFKKSLETRPMFTKNAKLLKRIDVGGFKIIKK